MLGRQTSFRLNTACACVCACITYLDKIMEITKREKTSKNNVNENAC